VSRDRRRPKSAPDTDTGTVRPARTFASVPRALGRLDLKLCAAVFLAAFALRVLYLGEIVHQPEFDLPAVDAGYHDYWAWGLASGEWAPPPYREDPQIQSTPYFRPPLCPYFLALIYSIFGHNYVAVRVVQMLLGSLSCVLAYVLAARLFDRGTAIVSGGFMAGYWVFIYFDSELREVVLLVFLLEALVLGLLSLRVRPGPLRALGCGVLLGLAALAKPNALLLIPVVILWLLLVNRPGACWRRGARVGTGLVVGTILTIAPAFLRNSLVAKDGVFISANGGINLYAGNNPVASGYDVRLPPPLPEFASSWEYPQVVRHVQRIEGRPMKGSEVSGWFARQALEHVRSDPGGTAALVLRKAILFWGGVEIVSERDLNAARGESALLRLLPGDFSTLLACAVVGFVFTLGRPGERRPNLAEPRAAAVASPHRADLALIVLLVGTYFVSFLPFFVTARYRAAIIPFMVVFAAYGLVRIAVGFLEGRVVTGVVALVAIVALYLGNSVDYYNVSDDGFKAAYDRAVALGKKGRPEDAITHYREALRIRPYAPKAHNNLGLLLAERGEAGEAIEHYAQALLVQPEYAEAHNNLGAEFLKQGDLDGAVVHCGEAVRLRPEFVLARKNLALALALQGRNDEAIDQYREALRVQPRDAGARYNLGILLSRQGRIEEAIREYRTALEIQPDDARTRQALDEALAQQGGIDRS